jgi:hypothetical protein
MQVFVCNVCERPLDGPAYEFSTISGNAVVGEQGVPRITQRHQLRLLHLCERCGDWLQRGIETAGESLAAATALRHDTRWFGHVGVEISPNPAERLGPV